MMGEKKYSVTVEKFELHWNYVFTRFGTVCAECKKEQPREEIVVFLLDIFFI